MTSDALRRLNEAATHPRTIFDAVTNADEAQRVERYVMVRQDDLKAIMAALLTQLPSSENN